MTPPHASAHAMAATAGDYSSVAGGFSVEDFISLTMRLAQLLAQEADYLKDLKVKSIEPLQEEKLSIASALEAQKKLIFSNPAALARLTEGDFKQLRRAMEIFDTVAAENHRRLLLAREVNRKVVETIAEVVIEHAGNRHYNHTGSMGAAYASMPSVTLNQTI